MMNDVYHEACRMQNEPDPSSTHTRPHLHDFGIRLLDCKLSNFYIRGFPYDRHKDSMNAHDFFPLPESYAFVI
jgi:hypothetical protein